MSEHFCLVPSLCPRCRYLPSTEVRRLRGMIENMKQYGHYDVIEFKAFNKEEADAVKALLTDEERKLVFFSWLEFK